MPKKSFVSALAILAVAGFMGPAGAAGPATVSLAHKTPFGGYLANGAGHTLYAFTADKGGASTCYDACAVAWPPLIASGTPSAGEGVEASRLGVTVRRDGTHQVTYAGMPLYTFKGDKAAGTTAGEEIDHFGGEWYVLSAKGQMLEKEGTAKTSKW